MLFRSMTLTKSIAMAVIVAALGVGGSQTQAQDSRSQPAEFPPSSYKGKQYVDSAGCVFIRAGIDGNVSWVPRMSRARQQICGFQPTNGVQVAAAQATTAAKTKVEAAPAKTPPTRVAEVQAPKVKPQAPVARPAPQKVVRRVAPAPVRASAPKVVRETAPRPVPVVPSKPVALAAPAPAGLVTACPGASPLSQRYMRRGDGYSVRCGPQAEPIVTGRQIGRAHV